MMADHSIRLRFVGRLRRFLDEVVERVAKHLREDEVHPHPGANDSFESAAFNPRGSEAYLQVPVDVARVNEEIGTRYGEGIILSDRPLGIAYAKRLSSSSNNFISHQKSPIGKVYDVSSLNARNAGVQS